MFILGTLSLLIIIIYFLFYCMSFKINLDSESVSSYECGFDMMSMARGLFSYRFFLISILFLIFDVEIALMLPVPYYTSLFGSLVFIFFIFILVSGLLYEYYYGALNWL